MLTAAARLGAAAALAALLACGAGVAESARAGAAGFSRRIQRVWSSRDGPQFTRINWIGKTDPRRQLTDIPELVEMHFKQAEIARVRACSGIIICPKSENDRMTWGSATSVESSRQVVTSVHILFNGANSPQPTLHHDIRACYFQNYLRPTDHIAFSIDPRQVDHWTNQHFNEDPRQQDAVVQLQRPIPDCDPFPVDRSNRPLTIGEAMVSIGHATVDMLPRVSGKEPIGEICSVRDRDALAGKPAVYKTDCSSNPGQSGSVQLVLRCGLEGRKSACQWEAKSIITTSGPEYLDGKPYDESMGSYTDTLGIEDSFLREVLDGAGVDTSAIGSLAPVHNPDAPNPAPIDSFFKRFAKPQTK